MNCNGDQPKLQDREFLKNICENDIICLSEIHTGFEEDINIEGYHCFKLCRPQNKKIKRFFGGIAIYYKISLKEGIKFLEHKNDDYVWFKLSKISFGLPEDVFMCYAYIPPENSSYYKARGQDTLSFIEDDIQKFSDKGSVFLCGDLNSRTGCEPDYIAEDYISDEDRDNCIYEIDLDISQRNSQHFTKKFPR